MEQLKFDNFSILYKKPKKNVVSFYLFWEVLIPIAFYLSSGLVFLFLKDVMILPKIVLIWLLYFVLGHIVMAAILDMHTQKNFKNYNFYKNILFINNGDKAVLDYHSKTWYIDLIYKKVTLESFLDNKIEKDVPFNKNKKYVVMIDDTVEIKEY